MGISSLFRCGVVLLLLAVASCGSSDRTLPVAVAPVASPETESQMVQVGLLLPLSSPDAATRQVAQAMLEAAELALFDAALPQMTLLPRDTYSGTGSGTGANARDAGDAVLAEGADVILGPLLSGSVREAARAAGRRNVPVIAFSNDSGVAGDGVYLLSFPPEQDTAVIARYALGRGLRRFALLAPQTDYGSRVSAVFTKTIEAGGGTVTDQAFYPRVSDGAFDPVRRLAHYDERQAAALADFGEEAAVSLEPPPYQAVLLPEGGAMLRTVAPLLPYFDIDPRTVRLLGTSLWDDPGLARSAALQGGWFPAPSPVARAEFSRRFERAYGYAPPRLASLAYDGVSLAATLAANRLSFSDDNLTRPDGFGGIDGIFRFGRDGLAERGLAVMEITPGGGRIVAPAPARFPPAGG